MCIIALLVFKDLNISSYAYGRGQIIFGDYEGNLYFLTRDLGMVSFRAYGIRVSHLVQLRQHNFLISVGVSFFVNVFRSIAEVLIEVV